LRFLIAQVRGQNKTTAIDSVEQVSWNLFETVSLALLAQTTTDFFRSPKSNFSRFLDLW
jgi:hypothetical protein